MGAQGTTTVTFGAFPGSTDCSTTVTGQAGILSTSLVEAWIFPIATADHTADEHVIEPLEVCAGAIVVGTGFTIWVLNRNSDVGVDQPRLEQPSPSPSNLVQIDSPMSYGLYTVAWVWN